MIPITSIAAWYGFEMMGSAALTHPTILGHLVLKVDREERPMARIFCLSVFGFFLIADFLRGAKMRFLVGKILLAAVMAGSVGGVAWAEGNVADGSAVFQEQCAMCHGTTPGAVGVGPSLFGIYGKPAAGVPGYDFSPALMASHLTLDAAGLDRFLTSPQTAVPGTKMPYEGMTDAGQRADVIAYLAGLK